ncbi:MAG: hypothetical protein E6J00_06180 [Chloroflexi bacterium]|nr:MAG: hypothetical protein E6J00_06180 [Chloroflexota bacterium]
MALEATFTQLVDRLTELKEAIGHLQFAVDARSPRVQHHVADRLEDRVIPDLRGLTDAAWTAAGDAHAAAADPAKAAALGRSLMTCQRSFSALVRTLSTDLLAYAPMGELIGVSQERDTEWQVWTDGVINAIDRCQQPVYDVEQALLQCWQELLERVGMTAVSVTATNIGQQIQVAEPQAPVVSNAT